MTLGQNLQAARKAKGLSQETLAEQIGVSRQALGKWEKDTALPGLDNLQAAAQVLGVSVDTLLGTEAAGPALAVTLDAMRDLLAARDAEQRKHRRLWSLLGAAAAVVVVLLLVVQNLAYQRKMQSLTDSYAMLQSQLSSTTADLSTRMDELQDAVRQGKSTVLEWRWVPVDKLHRDVQSSWMPVLVQVTPSESTTGMTARLSVTYGDTTELHDMDVLAGDIYQAQLVFTVGQTYDLTIQWTAADGAAANEKLGTVDFTATQTEPELETPLAPQPEQEEPTRIMGAAPVQPAQEEPTRIMGAPRRPQPQEPAAEPTRMLDDGMREQFPDRAARAQAEEGTRVMPAASRRAQPAAQQPEPDYEDNEEYEDERDSVAETLIRWVPPITAVICAAVALCGFVYYQFVL